MLQESTHQELIRCMYVQYNNIAVSQNKILVEVTYFYLFKWNTY